MNHCIICKKWIDGISSASDICSSCYNIEHGEPKNYRFSIKKGECNMKTDVFILQLFKFTKPEIDKLLDIDTFSLPEYFVNDDNFGFGYSVEQDIESKIWFPNALLSKSVKVKNYCRFFFSVAHNTTDIKVLNSVDLKKAFEQVRKEQFITYDMYKRKTPELVQFVLIHENDKPVLMPLSMIGKNFEGFEYLQDVVLSINEIFFSGNEGFRPLSDIYGIASQIDNMIAEIKKKFDLQKQRLDNSIKIQSIEKVDEQKLDENPKRFSNEHEYLESQPMPNLSDKFPGIMPLVLEDIRKRVEAGTEQYGEPLKAFNGRIALADAYQEMIDGLIYMRQFIEEYKFIIRMSSKISENNRKLMVFRDDFYFYFKLDLNDFWSRDFGFMREKFTYTMLLRFEGIKYSTILECIENQYGNQAVKFYLSI